MRQGTESWEEVLCGREETEENSLGHGREKQRREVTAAWLEPAMGVFRGFLRVISAG